MSIALEHLSPQKVHQAIVHATLMNAILEHQLQNSQFY
jgi:hypothetical protein